MCGTGDPAKPPDPVKPSNDYPYRDTQRLRGTEMRFGSPLPDLIGPVRTGTAAGCRRPDSRWPAR